MALRGTAAVGVPLAALVSCASLTGHRSDTGTPTAEGKTVAEVRLIMGTTAEVRVSGLTCPVEALDAAFDAIASVDRRMSLWRESELLALNRAGEAVVSAETFAVIRHALEIASASRGAFDPTLEPLLRARGGFGGPRRDLAPADTRRLLSRVGYDRVTLEDATRRVSLAPGTRLVLDALAKGHAVDRARAALLAAGASSGLVDLGGSSMAVFGTPLTVDLRDPQGERRAWATFRLSDAALGTSGADQKPGHILDPRTGAPARSVLQATVVSGFAWEADALSTAAFVLGADEGLDLLVRRGAAGLVILIDNGSRVVATTPGFAEAFALDVGPGIALREARLAEMSP